MQITLNQKEIEQALVDYVGGQGISIGGKRISVVIRNAAEGLEAGINIDAGQGPSPILKSADPVSPGAQSVPETPSAPTAQQTPTANLLDDDGPDPDRDVLKAELDKLGIEYAPKARTATLVALLEEARAKVPNQAQAKTPPAETPLFGETPAETPVTESPAQEPAEGGLFGNSEPAATKEEEPPFDTGTTPATTEDDDRPLFGQ